MRRRRGKNRGLGEPDQHAGQGGPDDRCHGLGNPEQGVGVGQLSWRHNREGQPAELGGFPASTGLYLTPFCDRKLKAPLVR